MLESLDKLEILNYLEEYYSSGTENDRYHIVNTVISTMNEEKTNLKYAYIYNL